MLRQQALQALLCWRQSRWWYEPVILRRMQRCCLTRSCLFFHHPLQFVISVSSRNPDALPIYIHIQPQFLAALSICFAF